MSTQSSFKRQDNTAERLKTFKMRKSTPTEAVTNGLEGQQFNIFTPKTTTQNHNSTTSVPSAPPSAPSSRPNSHHRRRSSVSTRRESAEMMGLSTLALADLPSSEDDDTNSIRNRALWALEGKRDERPTPPNYLSGYSKVEIPELPVSNADMSADLARKSQPILSISGAMNKRDSLGRDRDSYGRVVSQALSIKDQLHTLLEEDEEEEYSQEFSSKHSPSTSSATSESFPTSRSAPANSRSNRLKPLRLSTSTSLTFSATVNPVKPAGPSLSEIAAKRRSSLSYRRSEDVNSMASASSNNPSYAIQFIRNPLPTPESTPTTSERPLSPTEQAFLFNNQASLLARISELERVLASRSRPLSFVSASSRHLSTSSFASESQSDEMLRLVQDLKTERDELSRSLGVTQSKVENLENQITVLNRRVENERKEAWIAKQSEQSLKLENSKLAKELDAANLQVRCLQEDLARIQEELQSRDALHIHRKDVSMPRSVERNPNFEDDDDDELAHYEDEDIGDVSFYSDLDDSTTSSFSPLQERRAGSLLNPTLFGQPITSPSSAASMSPPVTPLMIPAAPHKRSSSLEKGWSFPKGVKPVKTEPSQVDRFFNCLEVLDNEDLTQTPFPVNTTRDKYGFFTGEDEDEEEDFPFILPSQSLPESKSNRLSVPDAERYQLTPPLSPSTPSISATPHTSRPSQSGKQLSPSFIPKPSPPRNDSYLATPTSVPRVKISPVTPTPSTRAREPLMAKSPTKLPQPRTASNSTQSASSPSSGFQLLKGPLGFSALTNYLPWNNWSAEDGITKSTKEDFIPDRSTSSIPGPRTRNNPVYTSQKREAAIKSTHEIGNAERLILL